MENLIAKIKKIAAKNPDGFTVDLDLKPVPMIGFSVSIPETQNSFTDEDLKRVIRIAKKHDCCIGGWFNQVDRKYYYDASIIVNDRNEALNLAEKFNQLAIFDLENQKEIWI